MKRLVFGLLLVCWQSPLFGADANGYIALYECKSGGANCNVDVATYVAAACAQTITTADSLSTIESKLNTGSSPICVTNGDYTAKGTITLTASGTSGARRVMRYTRASDNDDEPWNQSGANQAIISKINTGSQDYWIFHRLAIVSMAFENGANFNILNRNLAEYQGSGGDINFLIEASTDNVLQNSVFRNSKTTVGVSSYAIEPGNGADRTYIVNNEIYDIRGHTIQMWATPTRSSDVVFENNDIYANDTEQTNGGTTATHEMSLSIKSSGTTGSPTRVIHNRMWGARRTDTAVCCDGGGEDGPLINIQSGEADVQYNLIQNNIFMDSQKGVNFFPSGNNRTSLIGNIFYKIRKYHTGSGSGPIDPEGAMDSSENYLNTVIDAESAWIGRAMTNGEIRCNAVISSGAATSSNGSGTQIDYNVYYSTTDSGETNKITKTLTTRANSTGYTAGAIMRTTATPPADGTAGDFIRVALNTGTSAGSPPTFCTRLNCQTLDNDIWWKAIRGPLVWKRKLMTVAGGETFYIPYARAKNDSDLPEFNSCPSNFADRSGVGINDATGFSSFSPDIRGVAR